MKNQIQKVMTKKIKSIPQGTPWLVANEMMIESRIRHLPVVDEAGDVIGIVSQKDLLVAEGLEDFTVDFFMSSPVVNLREDSSLQKAIFKMLELKISAVLVVDDKDEVVGIVTTDDLLWFLAKKLDEEEKKESGFKSFFSLQTVGEVSRMLSEIGI